MNPEKLCYTKPLFVSLFWGTLAGICNQGTNFVTNIILARILKNHFGELILYTSTNAMLQTFSLISLGTIATLLIAQSLQDKTVLKALIFNMYFVVVVLSLVVSAIILLINQFSGIHLWQIDSFVSYFFIIIWFIASSIDALQVAMLIGFSSFKDVAKVSLVKGCVSIIVVPVLTYFYGILGAISGYAISFSLSLYLNFFFLRKNCIYHAVKIHFSVQYVTIKKIIKSTIPLFLASVIIMPAQWGVNYIIFQQDGGNIALSIFGIANQWIVLIQFFPLQISKVILPYLTGHKDVTHYNTKKIGLLLSLSIAVILIIFSFLFGKYIIQFYGFDYAISKTVFHVSLFAALFSVINLYIGQTIIADGRLWIRTICNGLIAITLFMIFILVLQTSVMNALPIAYLCAFFVGSSALVCFVKRKP
jgi:O-antigen/teichoic acid export membrane protein